MTEEMFETSLEIGPLAINAYSRLSYTMWHALAEFIDNSTQSRQNYDHIIDGVLANEKQPLTVEITHDKINKQIRIKDNSIGMSREALVEALKIANPTRDSKGRSKYGMGMKTAACWIGNEWSVITAEWSSGKEYTATVCVSEVSKGERVKIQVQEVDSNDHYTEIVISDLNRTINSRTEENIREYLGSMYRFDLSNGRLVLLYNGSPIIAPSEREFDTDNNQVPYKRDIDTTINGKKVVGWVAVLKSGGRKFGGFSLFQNKRQIQGFPSAWKPRSIFGGVDDEGANNLVAQRLTGEIELDQFDVSHTKDAILFRDNEQDELEKYLVDLTKEYKMYASRKRNVESGFSGWTREKVTEMVQTISKELVTDEIKDAIEDLLPPLDAILAINKKQVESIRDEEQIVTIELLPTLKIIVSLQERSENDPYLTIDTSADPNAINIIINNLHPYYAEIDSADAKEECLRQYLYDAIAEYQVARSQSTLNQDAIRRKKNSLLQAKCIRKENIAKAIQSVEYEAIINDTKQ